MLEALIRASKIAFQLRSAAGILLKRTPDANGATTTEEVDDASIERIDVIGTKKQVSVRSIIPDGYLQHAMTAAPL